jgi:SAM-dependent methyltransferase
MDEAARREQAGIADIEGKVVGALKHPKPLDICGPVFNAVLAAQYYEVFEALQPPCTMAVYEPCVGASNPVILATEAFTKGHGRYVTINLNRKLREQLEPKIAHLKMSVRIIQDNAQQALAHLPPRSFDVACFHHAVNDILQTAVSEPRGMDTTAIDWFPNERQMIEWLAEDVQAGRLEQRGRPELMQIVRDAARLVRPGGFLLFDHWNWCRFIGVAWFPWDLFYNLIPMTRGWIAESGLPLSEVRMEGVDPQWWLALQII